MKKHINCNIFIFGKQILKAITFWGVVVCNTDYKTAELDSILLVAGEI